MFDISNASLNAPPPLNFRGTRGVAALSGIAAVLAGCGGGGGSSPVNNPQAANRDPVAGTAPVQDTTVNATAGEAIEAINLAEAFRDPDGGALTFTLAAERADGMTVGDFGLSVNDDGEIVGTPTVGGLLTITVTATDPGGAMYAQAFTLDTNRVPTVANAVGDVAEMIGEAIEPIDLSDLFTDPDGDTLTLSVDFSRALSGLEFDEETNQINGTLTGTANTTITITVTVIDGRGATVDHSFEITANAAPTVVITEAPSETLVLTTGQNLDPTIDTKPWFVDSDGTVSDIEIVSGLDGTGLVFDEMTHVISGMFIGTADATVLVRATDNHGATVDHRLEITANAAPTVVPAEVDDEVNLTFETDENLPIDLSDWFDDAADDTLTYTATVGNTALVSAGIGLEVSGNQITGTFAGTANVTVEVTARDNHRATSAPHTFTITATVPDLVGTEGNNGDLTDNAPNWDRTIRGLGGNDTITGGEGDDMIDGGAGDDTAVYIGARNDYLIRRNGDDFIVRHGENGDMSQGRDTLTNVEMIKFGDADAVALEPNPLISVRENLGANIYATPDSDITPIDVSEWFANVNQIWTDYTISGNTGSIGGGFTLNGNMLSGRGPRGEVDITITASDVPELSFDDISRTFTLSIADQITTGNNGGDTLTGTEIGERITGGGGSDTITGGGGNDIIDGKGGNSDRAIYAGDFADFIITGSAPDGNIIVKDTNASAGGDEGTDTLISIESFQFSGNDIVFIIEGTTGVDSFIEGSNGSDLIFGFGGADVIKGRGYDDVIHGGAGKDIALYDVSIRSYVIGVLPENDDNGDPVLTVRDTRSGSNEGKDTLTGIETLRFGTLSGDNHAQIDYDIARSTPTNSGESDILIGGMTDETLDAGGKDDWIFGRGGNDTLRGGAGNDTLTGGADNDIIDGGGNDDVAVYAGNRDGFTITSSAPGENIMVVDTNANANGDEGTDTLSSVERLQFGEDLFHIIEGTTGMDSNLGGNDENDLIFGFGANDTIYGGAGNDVITGGAGNDAVNGDGGDDTAVYAGAFADFTFMFVSSMLILVVDANTTADGDEGTDALSHVERIQFGRDVFRIVQGTNGADSSLDGDNGNDLILGFEGKDVIEGGLGDDIIDGGAGNEDTAVYAGDRGDYSIWEDGDNFIVLDKESDPDESEGRDTLSNIEKIKFGDANVVDLDDALASDTSVPPGAIRAPRKDGIAAFSVEDDVTPTDVLTGVRDAPVNACVDCDTEIDPMSPWTSDDPCGCFG